MLILLDFRATQAIRQDLLPQLNSKIVIQKKADYAWSFSSQHPTVGKWYHRLSLAGQGLSLSQITDSFSKRIALYCGVEVKRSGGDDQESLAQLCIWLAAGVRKLDELRKSVDGKAPATAIPADKSMNIEESQVEIGSTANVASGNAMGDKLVDVLPLVGWTVQGHTWSIYIAWKGPNGSVCAFLLSFCYLTCTGQPTKVSSSILPAL